MKSEVKRTTEELTSYPWLGEFTNEKKESFVVLFAKKGEGVVVNTTTERRRLGEYIDNLNMSLFTKFDGTVTLAN
jgi:hypothetical protein